MTAELAALATAAIIQGIQFALYAGRANVELGTRITLGPRDGNMPEQVSIPLGRLQRALDNHFEGLILFTIAVVVVTLSGAANGFTAACAWTYILARILYVPAYVFGLVPWRTIIWAIGYFATMLMILWALVA